MVCFMEPLDYWWLGWFLLMQRWKVESPRGKKDFPRPETHGALRMSIVLVLNQEAPWLAYRLPLQRKEHGEKLEALGHNWRFLDLHINHSWSISGICSLHFSFPFSCSFSNSVTGLSYLIEIWACKTHKSSVTAQGSDTQKSDVLKWASTVTFAFRVESGWMLRAPEPAFFKIIFEFIVIVWPMWIGTKNLASV